MALGAGLLLAACAPAPTPPAPDKAPGPTTHSMRPQLPPVRHFGVYVPEAPHIANADLARDFLDLTFQLESGRALPVLTRFEGPVRVTVQGATPPGMMRDLTALISRLQDEAGIDIALAPTAPPTAPDSASEAGKGTGSAPDASGPPPATGATGTGGGTAPVNMITIQPVSGDDIRGELPDAACFVIPGIRNLSEFHGARRQDRSDWAKLTTRSQLAIFVPNDAAPQETRDCMHEELAQALGPLNDLFRLNDSIFNDDNVHSVLTGFDMLVLRITYAPELHSGMTKAQVAAQLPALLARLNPEGQRLTPTPLPQTTPEWRAAVQQALGAGGSPAARLRGAQAALAIAGQQGWRDHRMGFSEYILGRLLEARDPNAALAHMRRAHAVYSATPATRLYAAQTGVALARDALRRGDAQACLALLQDLPALAEANQNASLLAQVLMLQAEAHAMQGRDDLARAARLDSLGWARYGFGPTWAILAKLQDVADLPPDTTSEPGAG